ncbi:MAG: cation transporter [Eubacterium sp.]|nr:cation transporter [Eubacterium sp.]
MGKLGIKTAVFGLTANFVLFLVKLYISISSNSLSIYCDAINNLTDTLSCAVALVGFIVILKLDERRSKRVQSLASFLIGIIITAIGLYFAYNGVERLMYPTAISYSKKYALLVAITIFVKIFMGIVYILINKKQSSPVFKALIIDSFLDSAITLAAFLGFSLTPRVNYAIDGVIAVLIGITVAVSAIKSVIQEAKYLINN